MAEIPVRARVSPVVRPPARACVRAVSDPVGPFACQEMLRSNILTPGNQGGQTESGGHDGLRATDTRDTDEPLHGLVTTRPVCANSDLTVF